eukprot:g33404.t1
MAPKAQVTAASKRTATPPPKKKEVVPTPRPPEAAAKPAATKAVAPSEEKAPNLKSEWGNIALLCLLYTLQGIPLDSTTTRPSTRTLTGLFLAINFLCATQDIAVDGWALTMLRKENCNYQATCNAAGQTFGALDGGKEKPLPPEEEPEGIRDAYMQMLRMTGLRPIQFPSLRKDEDQTR